MKFKVIISSFLLYATSSVIAETVVLEERCDRKLCVEERQLGKPFNLFGPRCYYPNVCFQLPSLDIFKEQVKNYFRKPNKDIEIFLEKTNLLEKLAGKKVCYVCVVHAVNRAYDFYYYHVIQEDMKTFRRMSMYHSEIVDALCPSLKELNETDRELRNSEKSCPKILEL